MYSTKCFSSELAEFLGGFEFLEHCRNVPVVCGGSSKPISPVCKSTLISE